MRRTNTSNIFKTLRSFHILKQKKKKYFYNIFFKLLKIFIIKIIFVSVALQFHFPPRCSSYLKTKEKAYKFSNLFRIFNTFLFNFFYKKNKVLKAEIKSNCYLPISRYSPPFNTEKIHNRRFPFLCSFF